MKKKIFESSFNESSFHELSTPRSGSHINWRRGELIGEGAYAKVFQCINKETGQLFAIKSFSVIFMQIGDTKERIQKQINSVKAEIRILRRLSHENIVRYYQADLAEDMKTIDVLLEYVPGGTLKSILQKYENLEIPIIKKYGKQLLSGLMYLHGNKIIHRDLKPANVLINQDGILKLTDFGSCREFGDLEVSISRSLKGSPYWMAPEVVKMEGHSFSADIWSFGCMLIEMISGRPPWSNISNDSKQVMELISKEDPWDQIPSTECELTEIIKLCLNKRPDLRPSAEDLLNLPFFQSCYK